MKGVIFHGKLELGILGIPRFKNNDCEFPGILRKSKLKENQLLGGGWVILSQFCSWFTTVFFFQPF